MAERTNSLTTIDCSDTQFQERKPETSKEDDIDTVKDGDIEPGKGDIELVKNGDIEAVKGGDVETGKDGDIEPVKDKEIETVKDGDIETGKDGDIDAGNEGDIDAGKEGCVEPGKDGIMGGDWRRVISQRRGTTCSVEFITRMKASEASVSLRKVQRQFCTGSRFRGLIDAIGMEGQCLYTMPHDVEFDGEMHEGHFHGIGTLYYPNGSRIDGTFYMGALAPATYTFNDGLVFEARNWTYCSHFKPDRRFQQEIEFGLRPVCTSLKTQGQPTRKIPEGCYDTGDGFFNPRTRCVTSVEGEIIRIPTGTEVQWIVQNCRKSWDEVAGFRRDSFDSLKKDDVNYAPLLMEKRRKSLLGHQKSAEGKRMTEEFCKLLGLQTAT